MDTLVERQGLHLPIAEVTCPAGPVGPLHQERPLTEDQVRGEVAHPTEVPEVWVLVEVTILEVIIAREEAALEVIIALEEAAPAAATEVPVVGVHPGHPAAGVVGLLEEVDLQVVAATNQFTI